MINLPEFNEQTMYDAETTFHLLLTEERLGKFLVHWEAMKMVQNTPGTIVECGVFKGTSFMRLALMRSFLGSNFSAKLLAFDMFGDAYPETSNQEDFAQRSHWIDTAGPSSISTDQLSLCLTNAGVSNF